MNIHQDNDELIHIQPSTPVNSIRAFSEWGVGGSDVGININRGGVVICAIDLTVAEALELAEQLEHAAVVSKYMSLGYTLSQTQ